MIKVLHLDQPQQVRIVDVEGRFAEEESPKVSLILELFGELGVHGVDGLSPEEVVAAEGESSLGVWNTEGLPLSKVLGNIAVQD